MKIKTLLILLTFGGMFAVLTSEITSSSGKVGYAGSPSESTCVSCHGDYALNSGSGSLTISSNIPLGGYTPGQTYQMQVTVAQTGQTLFGFDIEALTSANAMAGTFVITSATDTKLGNKIVGSVTRVNVTHTGSGNQVSNTKTFSFNWTAPANNVGAVTFYSTGNAANNDGGTGGDYIYSKTLVIQALSTGVKNIANEKDFAFYYNSLNSSVHIKMNNLENTSVKAMIYSITGQLVGNVINEVASGSIEKDYNVSNLNKGVYFIQVQQNDKSFTQKFFVN